MNRLKAIILAKCPQCRSGSMFEPAALHLFKKQHMHKHCPVCSLDFELEPGFYWGAMYFSYALNVAESVALAVVAWLISVFSGFSSPWLYVAVIIPGIFLFMNLNFRYGRVLLIYFFGDVRYDASFNAREEAAGLAANGSVANRVLKS